MNQMTRHTQRFLALLLVEGASLYLTGCGPGKPRTMQPIFADFNDNDNGMVVDGAGKERRYAGSLP